MVAGGMKCIKYLLFFFNLLFFLSGLLLIVAGSVLLSQRYLDFLDEQSGFALAVVLIVVGAIIFVIAFFGCFGAIRENYCLIVTFAVFLFLILVLEFAIAIAAFVMQNKLKEVIRKTLDTKVANYHKNDDVTIMWDNMQIGLHCCGAENYTDWLKNDELRAKNMSVPNSCCQVTDCNTQGLAEANLSVASQIIYTENCVDGMSTWAKRNIGILGGIAAALTFVQIMGIILACCLAKAVQDEYRVV